MCGIITYISKDRKTPAGEKVLNQFEDQASRGKEGFGVVEIFKDHVNILRSTEPIKALIDAKLSKAPIMMFHHRTPTSTENKIAQTHPMLITHDELQEDWIVIHNGVIRNSDDLFKKHTEELGYAYRTFVKSEKTETEYQSRMGYAQSSYWKKDKFNDSEAFAIEIARFLGGRCQEIDIEGSMAFIAVSVNKATGKPGLMYWGRNDTNPCEMFEDKNGLLIASAINELTAVKAEANSYVIFNLPKFLEGKVKDLSKCINQEPLYFKEKPVVEKTLALPEKSTTASSTNGTDKNTNGDANTATGRKVVTGKEIKERLEKEWNVKTPREEAFMKMSERVGEKMQEILDDLFLNMAYGEITTEDIEFVTTELHNMIVEKEEKACEKLREKYDADEKAMEEYYQDQMEKDMKDISEGLKRDMELEAEADARQGNIYSLHDIDDDSASPRGESYD